MIDFLTHLIRAGRTRNFLGVAFVPYVAAAVPFPAVLFASVSVGNTDSIRIAQTHKRIRHNEVADSISFTIGTRKATGLDYFWKV